MPDTPTELRTESKRRTMWMRLGWFVLLWAAGVVAIGTLSFLVRIVLR